MQKSQAARIVFSTLSILALNLACSSPPRFPETAPQTSGEGQRQDLETVVILGTNDIHGALVPQEHKTREASGVAPTDYRTGGVAYLASYVRMLRNHFGSRLIWLDAGDQFQGTIESNLELGAPLVQFFNTMGLNASAVGNHEFDFGLPALKSRMSEAVYPYLGANIVSKNPAAPEVFPNLHSNVVLTAGDLKIGVIGLSTLDTPTTTRAENVKTLEFTSLKDTTLREAKLLRTQGAQAVVIVAHVGLKCDPGHAAAGATLRHPQDPQGECGEHDEMVRLLKALPPGTVDAVVAGHSHQIVHHFLGGIPVIEGGASGRYFNLIYLTYDRKHQKIVPENSLIEGPVPVCPKVFSHQGDCNGDGPAPHDGRGKLVDPVFHGKTMGADSAIESWLEPVIQKSLLAKNHVVGTAARALDHVRFGESPVGDMIADAVRSVAGTDVAIVNSGGIRAPLEAGQVTYGQVFQVLPFDNYVATLSMTGRELKLMLRIGESGSRGFMAVSGVKLRLIDPSCDAPSTDLNGNHKDEAWEVNRILDEKLANGSKILDSKTYTVATLDFLVTGGDDLGWFMSKVPPDHIQWNTGGLIRDAVVKYLEKAGPVNTVEHPLPDPENPRLKFVKVEKGSGRRHKTRRRKR